MSNSKWIFVLAILFSTNAFAFDLTSSAFAPNQMIPIKYTCQGENISPPLSWQNIPPKTKSFALIMEDPDATKGVWDHWIIFNIPVNTTQLPENAQLPIDAKYGANSWKKNQYDGPCPPSGTHRYIFHLYAVDKVADLSEGISKQTLMQTIQDHIIGKAELVGLYSKR